MSSRNLIYYYSICYFHNIIYNMFPPDIIDLLNVNLTRTDVARYIRKLTVKLKSDTKRMGSTLLYKGIEEYRQLPDVFYTYNIVKFKTQLKLYVSDIMKHDELYPTVYE